MKKYFNFSLFTLLFVAGIVTSCQKEAIKELESSQLTDFSSTENIADSATLNEKIKAKKPFEITKKDCCIEVIVSPPKRATSYTLEIKSESGESYQIDGPKVIHSYCFDEPGNYRILIKVHYGSVDVLFSETINITENNIINCDIVEPECVCDFEAVDFIISEQFGNEYEYSLAVKTKTHQAGELRITYNNSTSPVTFNLNGGCEVMLRIDGPVGDCKGITAKIEIIIDGNICASKIIQSPISC